ncbi:MAG: hypothetical protein ABSD90_11725 [Methylocystis sp.]
MILLERFIWAGDANFVIPTPAREPVAAEWWGFPVADITLLLRQQAIPFAELTYGFVGAGSRSA